MAGIRSSILIVLIGITASVMAKCLNEKPKTAANAFLISKWKLYYKALDANHDGKVTIEDAEEQKNSFSDLENLDAEERKVAIEGFTTYWDKCIFEGKTGEIKEHEYIERLTTKINANKVEFVKEIDRCFQMIFSAIDINKDKSISKDELLITYAAFGHQQIANDNDYFSAYTQKDGLVPFRVMIDYWVDLFTGTDESKGNIVKSAFEVDGLE